MAGAIESNRSVPLWFAPDQDRYTEPLRWRKEVPCVMAVPMRGRFALWYGITIASLGAFHPYLAVIVDRAGATGAELALILAVFPLGLLIAAPIWASVVDRTGRPRLILLFGLFIAALGAWWIAAADSWLGMLPGVILIAAARSPSVSVVDVLVARNPKVGPSGYGRVRMWGSVGFIVAVWIVGWLLDSWPAAPLVISAGLLTLACLFALTLPAETTAPTANPSPLKLVGNAPLVALCAVTAIHIATVSSYDHLFSLHAVRIGLPTSLLGTAVALGVTMEALVMAAGGLLLRRFSAGGLILLAVAASIPRWWLTGTVTDHTLLVLLQSLHGLSFGAFWVGGIAIVTRHAPSHLRNTAQGVFLASGWGLGSLLSMGGVALFLDDLGTDGFFQALAGVSVLALLVTFLWLRPSLGKQACT